MTIDIKKISEFLNTDKIEDNKDKLENLYCSPILSKKSPIPEYSFFPTTVEEISKLLKFFRTIKPLNVVIISSQTNPKFLDDTITYENTVIIDLSNMKGITFINKRNKVCVVEPGVTWEELVIKLRDHGLRPLIPFLPRPGKSVLASILDREPHMIAKKQFDTSDPLLCMEVTFGNGEIFRTGEAAGPLSIEENRKAGAALTNPLGPAQTDIFRIIQGSKGTFGCVSWISMQCDLIPEMREIKFIDSEDLDPLVSFVYKSSRRRLVDEIFIINHNYLNKLVPNFMEETKEYCLIYSVNGYEILPEEKLNYQMADISDLLVEMKLENNIKIENLCKDTIVKILDGNMFKPHPKISEEKISIDLIYATTLDRIKIHLEKLIEITHKYQFPEGEILIYLQPIIQCRSVNVEFSLLADAPDAKDEKFPIEKVNDIIKECAKYINENGGFFSRSYKLINEYAFNDKNLVVQESLHKLKHIFDPDNILNKGELVF